MNVFVGTHLPSMCITVEKMNVFDIKTIIDKLRDIDYRYHDSKTKTDKTTAYRKYCT